MYVNYSLYGLDEKDFEDDGFIYDKKNKINVSWLNKIFHKNDGYQTPVVIHPYRESAMIDVRREKDLMKQRLAALIFTNNEYRTIIPEYSFNEIRFKLKDKSALEHFLENLFDNQQSDVIKADVFKEELSKEMLKEKIMFLSDWIDKNSSLLQYIKENHKTVNNDYDLKDYLFAAYAFIKNNGENKTFEGFGLTDKMPFSFYVLKVTQKDAIVVNIKKDVQTDAPFKKLIEKTSNMTLNTLISLIQLTISYEVLIKHFGYKENEIDFELNNSNKFQYHLFWYSVVKSVKTLKYNTHKVYSESFQPKNIFDNDTKKLDFLAKRYFVDIISKDKSHITDKLRRVVLLLELIKKPIEGIIDVEGKSIIFKSSNLIDYYSEIVNNSRPYVYNSTPDNTDISKDITELGKLINNLYSIYSSKNIELTDLLPPAIFDYDFYSSTKDKEEKIPLIKISSGQFQKISLLSSIVYHLKNLDSIQERANFNSYKQVLVVLDEIELYFHPEQQREFIYDLVELLKQNKFKKIENINIFFITHSPFILSDIPSQNVLKLDKGKPVDNDSYNSFGANIHDLLADEFFMSEGFIGKYAHDKIAITLNWLKIKANEIKQSKVHSYYIDNNIEVLNFKNQEDEYNYHRNIIELIGEPLVKNKLRSMFLKLEGNDPSVLQDELKKARMRVDELEKKLNNA